MIREARLVRNNLQIETSFLLFNQSSEQTANVEIFRKLPQNYTFSPIFGKVNVLPMDKNIRYVNTITNGAIIAARNNWVYTAIKPAIKTGYVLLAMKSSPDGLLEIDAAMNKLRKDSNLLKILHLSLFFKVTL